ncbi:hypothetical protein [Streptomyces sp. NBC_01618]|uniref:hypothetical protein n=1 Tax=Streptomyces sp. NBC_01618 TaxID=2975900 RepID=UPI0038696015|nr:hypothetical protein OH735_08440 [Streptomyces sp. NBC_01618]
MQYIEPSADWGVYGVITGDLGDGETYTVDRLPPHTGTGVWGHAYVVRVWDSSGAEDVLPVIHPGGTIPIPGLRLVLRTQRGPLPHPVVGSFAEAETAAFWDPDFSPYDDYPAGWSPVGVGSHRDVFLNPDRTIVYKVETQRGRNRREHRTLRGLRAQGYGYAPPTTLWTVPHSTPGSSDTEFPVLAMPYLPNDGTVPRAAHPQAGVVDLGPANITVCRGRYWLIDASGI